MVKDHYNFAFIEVVEMKKHDVNMLSGSITKGLWAISFPIMIMNVVQSLFNIIDMTILKEFDPGDGIAVGAVGVCSVLITLFTNLVIGIATGSNVVIARNIGKGDQEAVDRSVGSSVLFSLVAGSAMAAIGIICAPLLLHWNNCPSDLFGDATLYFRLYFVGFPIIMVYNFTASILRSSGDSRRPMVYLTAGGVLKVALTLLFTAVFHMGVAGVALATIFSQSLPCFLGLRALTKNQGAVKFRKEYFRFYKEELLDILRIGIPTSIQRVVYSFANVLITATVNSFGSAATTGVSIANQYDGILYNITTAPSLAVMPYVSQNIGAGNVKRATQSVWKSILITTGLGVVFGSLSAGFSGPLASIMSSDPTVISFAQQKMVLISSLYFVQGINEIFGAALRGMGKPTVATVCSFLYMCAFRFVWVYFIFPLCPTLTFLYLVWPIGWALCIITMLFVYFPTVKKLKEKAAV